MPLFETNPPVNQLENMSGMMNRLEIGRVAGDGAQGERVLAAAVRACEACPAGEICRDWLRRAAATLRTAPSFCPNASRFARLLAEK